MLFVKRRMKENTFIGSDGRRSDVVECFVILTSNRIITITEGNI